MVLGCDPSHTQTLPAYTHRHRQSLTRARTSEKAPSGVSLRVTIWSYSSPPEQSSVTKKRYLLSSYTSCRRAPQREEKEGQAPESDEEDAEGEMKVSGSGEGQHARS